MLKRINRVLPELIAGIVLYGIVVQFAGMWFVSDKQQYTLGLWLGILLAVGMAINIAIVILDAVDGMASKGTAVRTGFWSLLRYAVVVGVFAAVIYFKIPANPLVMFLGMMGLKVSAYLQPKLHTCIQRMQEKAGKRQA